MNTPITFLAFADTAKLDALSLYGFLSACLALGSMSVSRNQPWYYPLAAVLHLNLAAYAVLAGAWPIAMVLVAMTARYLFRWHVSRKAARVVSWYIMPEHQELLSVRARRMFGEQPQTYRTRESNN